MFSTGIFKSSRYQIEGLENGQRVYLVPFGDVHQDHEAHAADAWETFRETYSKRTDCYYLGIGDYQDLMSSKERVVWNGCDFHETTVKAMVSGWEGKVMRFQEQIEFMRGRLLGLMEGNHFAPFPSGITSTQSMAKHFGVPYLGVVTFLRLTLCRGRGETVAGKCSLDIWAHHGRGCASTMGGSLNAVERMAKGAQADIYLMGHDHKRNIGTSSRLYLIDSVAGLEVKSRPQMYVRTGGWLRGYVDGEATYVADAGLTPADIGNTEIEITYNRKQTADRTEHWLGLRGIA